MASNQQFTFDDVLQNMYESSSLQTTPPIPWKGLLTDDMTVDQYYHQDDLKCVIEQQKATNYMSAAMIFLRDNPRLERPLSFDDVKYRLLGHWGTCPGINMVYAHMNRVIRLHQDRDFFMVFGPGHGNPAVLANYYLEGTLGHFYHEYEQSASGFAKTVTSFSMPAGFPSHVNSQLPSINEGGELGYALSTAWGAVMDAPNTIVTCIVGDGENETGPSCTAWHSSKYVDFAESGCVLPILHVNGYKIAERTIYGCMSDEELGTLFTGFGYQPKIVSYDNTEYEVNYDLAATMDWSIEIIKKVQKAARSGKPFVKPLLPMIILRTPKGMGGVRSLHGKLIEGNFLSHQVPLPNAKTNAEELEALKNWLESYSPHHLFDKNGRPNQVIQQNLPPLDRCCGMHPAQYRNYQPLDVPLWSIASKDPMSNKMISSTKTLGEYLVHVIEKNPNRFRIFSPDELESNRLGDVLNVTTRNFQWDMDSAHKGGRVIEVLSEHQCQGFLQGYLLTGRHGLFPSYEAFLAIVSSMMIQFAKFIKIASEVPWRGDVASLNYLASSGWEIQSHNGLSHESTIVMNELVNMKSSLVRIYLPADANALLCTFAHCLRSRNNINLVVASKFPTPVYLTEVETEKHCIAGISIWHKFSSELFERELPDIILCCAGCEITFETIVAARMLQNLGLLVRVINVNDLMVLGGEDLHPHALSDKIFDTFFPTSVPVVFAFHGYPSLIKSLLFDRKVFTDQFTVLGFSEEGTTTTPFRMLTLNKVSRYNICIESLRKLSNQHPLSVDRHVIIANWQHDIRQHQKFAETHGKDPDDMYALDLIKESPVFDQIADLYT